MSNAVLISIQPKWCELIASGRKTVEVRKTRPKLGTPFKCYIYCTLQGSREAFAAWGKDVAKWNRENWGARKGMVIGEFICDSLIEVHYNDNGYGIDGENGIIARSCVTERDLYHYLQGKNPFIWHISHLVIYDKPRELSGFWVERDVTTDYPPLTRLKRPPQSWCYVAALGKEADHGR